MRSNSERVEEVFRRADNYDEILKREQRAKKKLWVKWVSCSLAIVLVCCSVIGLVIGLINMFVMNLDKMYIANFSSYQAIGLGGEDTLTESVLSSNGTQTFSSGSESFSAEIRSEGFLVGIKKDNEIEKCQISKTQNGKPQKMPNAMILSSFLAFKNFSFVEFRKRMYYQTTQVNNGEFGFQISYYSEAYVIDNRTGRFYALKNAFKDSVVNFTCSYSGSRTNPLDWLESGDHLIFSSRDIMSGKDVGVFKMSVQNERLVIERVVDSSNEYTKLNYRDAMIDRFNNIFLTGDSNYIVSGDKINTCEPPTMSLNRICYVDDGKKYFDENGELQDCEPSKIYFFESKYKVKTVGNIDYYYEGEDIIYKVTWQPDGIGYSVEEISVDGANEHYASTENHIYLINGDELKKINIESGQTETLPEKFTQFVFTSIQTDNMGNVLFMGLEKSTMNKVIGTIRKDGNITVLTKPREYQIFYIAAVNR